MGAELRKYGVEATFDFTLFEVDGIDFRVDAVHATGDSSIMKDEGTEANTSNSFTDEGSGYSLVLTATEMQAARIAIYLVDQTATKVWLDTQIIIETYGNVSAQHAFDLDTASVPQTADHTAAIAAIPTTAMRGTDSAATSAKQDTMETTLNTIPTTAMRGTDSAATSAKQDTMETTLNAIPTTAMRGTDGANTVVPDAAGTAPTVAEILTTQMTEAYAADGVPPTLAQALMLIQQSLTEFAIASTTKTIKKLDGTTTAATETLDDASSPTSITRSS